MAKNCILILGGARSGKSRFAQELAAKLGDKVLFVATGAPLDDEMQARIDDHKKTRPQHWQTLEISKDIGRKLAKTRGFEVVLVDCLTLLVANLLGDETEYRKAEKLVLAEIKGIISAMDRLDATFIFVSNEVGMGLVPDNKLGRVYRDLLGKANQLLAQHADEVYFMVAGIPVNVKPA